MSGCEKEDMNANETKWHPQTPVKVIWVDSYGVSTGWQAIDDYKAEELEVTSFGVIIYSNEKVLALAHNYCKETALTPEQANGIMVIPRSSIKSIISYSSSCQESE